MLFENDVKAYYMAKLFTRQDNANGFFYFTPEDFPGLQAHPYSFRSSMGHALNGFFYHCEAPRRDRLLVFDHGMGNGHRAYMTEIATLCRAGWLVFAYDHTGCMSSGGENVNGFSQSLADLDDCFRALKRAAALKGRTFSVMGHSWGGFSTMNIAAFHPEITHVVAMSGFISPERMIQQFLPGPLGVYVPAVMEIELARNPSYARCSALETLRKTSAHVLLIHAKDDPVVKKEVHFDPLFLGLQGKPHVEFLLLEGRGHNPSYTADAAHYSDQFQREARKAIAEKRLETPEQQKEFMARYDWRRKTAQDKEVWAKILAHLEK